MSLFDLFNINIFIITIVLTTVLHASDIIISKPWFLISSASESRLTDAINVDDYDKVLLEHTKGIYLIIPCGIQRTFPR